MLTLSLQNLKVVAVEKKSYGNFHTGDSYIVLHVSHGQDAWRREPVFW